MSSAARGIHSSSSNANRALTCPSVSSSQYQALIEAGRRVSLLLVTTVRLFNLSASCSFVNPKLSMSA